MVLHGLCVKYNGKTGSAQFLAERGVARQARDQAEAMKQGWVKWGTSQINFARS
jgi:hypothetical protein